MLIKKEDKKAQFYLIAAIIIIVLLIAILGVGNFARKKEDNTKIYDLSKEIDYEVDKVISYGIYYEADSENLVSQLITEYESRIEPETDLIFIYGKDSDYKVTSYKNVEKGSMKVKIGNTDSEIITHKRNFIKHEADINIGQGGDKAIVTFSDEETEYEYDFNLKQGENFFFVIKKQGNVVKSE